MCISHICMIRNTYMIRSYICKEAQYKVLIYSYICGSRIVITILLLQHTERKTLVSPLCKLLPSFSFSLCYFEIQRARVNGVTLLRVLINEPRAPSSPYPTSFSPLDSTPSIFNHKEVSAPPPPQLSRLLLWPVIATYICTCSSIFFRIAFHTRDSPVLVHKNILPQEKQIYFLIFINRA